MYKWLICGFIAGGDCQDAKRGDNVKKLGPKFHFIEVEGKVWLGITFGEADIPDTDIPITSEWLKYNEFL